MELWNNFPAVHDKESLLAETLRLLKTHTFYLPITTKLQKAAQLVSAWYR